MNRNSANSFKPPSGDGPHMKPAPPEPPSGKTRGGQPGHLVERMLTVVASCRQQGRGVLDFLVRAVAGQKPSLLPDQA